MCVPKLYCINFWLLLSCCNAYNILVIFPYPAKSHGILGDGVVRNLLKAGHEVTYISPYPYSSASSSIRMIDVSDNINVVPGVLYDFNSYINKEHTIDYSPYFELLIKLMSHTTRNANVQKILNDPQEHFDVVIMDWCFSELLAGFAALYNCPYIWVSSLQAHWLILRLIDEPSSPAYSADILSTVIPPFTFWERVKELYIQLKVSYLKYMYFDQLERQEYEKLFAPYIIKRGRQLPSYEDLQFNASLMFGISHASIGESLPTPHNYISVGGYYIEEDVKLLPAALKMLMDNAKNGVIYFSLGSNLKSKDIPNEIKASILQMFSELNQTVLWKFEGELLETPQNVHILKWAPQHCILAHPNIKLFITHGGLLSTTEAIHFGVPIIGIPVTLDQFTNVARAVKHGIAKKIVLSYNMAEELKTVIEEMINNPRYTERAKELSFIYHDRPVKPGKELAHWVRHVIETRGAPHLRSPALHVPLYQKLYIDLFVVFLIILFFVIKLIKYLFCCITFCKLIGSNKIKKTK